MTNNIFNIRAAEAGREFARANPEATGIEVDDASPKFNPARRHFQEACYDLLNRIRSGTFYRYNIKCRTGHEFTGMAHTSKEAQELLMDQRQLFMDRGLEVVHYAIYNQNEVCVLSMDTTS